MQNGVLKALSFMFEYIGEMGRDYVYTAAPLLEDALMDRDLVHRQIASNVVQHVSLGVVGLGCEDILQHLLNYVWPNIFEESPHLINAVGAAIDGCRLALGPGTVLAYVLQVRVLRLTDAVPCLGRAPCLCAAHLLSAHLYVRDFRHALAACSAAVAM